MNALCIIWFTLIFALEILSCLGTSIEKLHKYMAYHIIVDIYIIFINKFQLWEFHMWWKVPVNTNYIFYLELDFVMGYRKCQDYVYIKWEYWSIM